MLSRCSICPHSAPRGFTLMELLVAVAVSAVLATLAYPSFADQVRKSRRLDAVQALAQVQGAQERWRARCPCYAGSLTDSAAACPATACAAGQGLGMPQTTTRAGHYALALSDVTPTGYTLVASALPGGPQARDATCATLGLTVRHGTASPWPAACWSR